MKFVVGNGNSAFAHYLPPLIGWLTALLYVTNIGLCRESKDLTIPLLRRFVLFVMRCAPVCGLGSVSVGHTASIFRAEETFGAHLQVYNVVS
jgi:hypothetical protein